MGKRRRLMRQVAALVVVITVAQAAGPTSARTRADGAVGDRAHSAEPATPSLRVRKNVMGLTVRERGEFVSAVLALKSAPSPFDPDLSYYDQFVVWHLGLYPCGMGHEMMRAHGGPMFLPWHRLFLLLFENALREVSGKRITVPYWDWTDPASTATVFADDLMGGDGDPDHGFAVTTGAFRKGRWTLNVHPIGVQWRASATTHLTRRFGSFPAMPTLPEPEDVTFVLGRPSYDVAPFDGGSDPNLSFRSALEGFWRDIGSERVATGSTSMVCGPDGVMMATSGEATHNRVHGWVGGLLGATTDGIEFGTMLLPTSPNDPVFFLHHSNIDRLWAQWQQTHGIDSYEPAACNEETPHSGCRGNTRTDPMHPPFEATPDDVADVRDLGYRYDTMETEPVPTAPGGATAEFTSGRPSVCEIRRTGRERS